MKPAKITAAILFAFAACAAQAQQADETPLRCGSCAKWNQPTEPFRLHGNSFYVGTKELSAVLIAGPEGHILLDGALPQSAPLIRTYIEKLGYRIEDVKLILNSHAHFDHAGGIAALQRYSGAPAATSAIGAAAMRAGSLAPEDPQFETTHRYPPVPNVKEVADGEVLRVGPLAVTAIHTPGHTPGGTSWRWRSCEGRQCADIVYADSLTAISLGAYRYSGGHGQPDRSAAFRASIEKIAAQPCTLLVSTHPEFSALFEKLARRTGQVNTLIDANACKDYAANAMRGFEARLKREASPSWRPD